MVAVNLEGQMELDIPVRSTHVEEDGPFDGLMTTEEFEQVERLMYPWTSRSGRQNRPQMDSDGVLYKFNFKYDDIYFYVKTPDDLLSMAVSMVATFSEFGCYGIFKDGRDLKRDGGTSNMIWRVQYMREELSEHSKSSDRYLSLLAAIQRLCLLCVWTRAMDGHQYEEFDTCHVHKPDFWPELDKALCHEHD